jgi:hypothetical protein
MQMNQESLSNDYPEWANWEHHCGDTTSKIDGSCPAVALAPHSKCIAHLDEEALSDVLETMDTDTDFVLDVRGAIISIGLASKLSTEFDKPTAHQNQRGKPRRFLSAIRMDHATILGHLSISNVSVAEGVSLDRAVFKKNFFLTESEVGSTIDFGRTGETQIAGELLLSNVRAHGVFAEKLEVSGRATLIDVDTRMAINLSYARFMQLATLRVVCSILLLSDAIFEEGFLAQVGDAEVELDRALLRAPSILAWRLEDPFGLPRDTVPSSDAAPPRLLSFDGCALPNLTLHNVDLRPCRFWGGFGLDRLTLEGQLNLCDAPGRWRTRRKLINDEQLWRSVLGPERSRRLWTLPSTALPQSNLRAELRLQALEGDDPSSAARTVASIYRELRKGLEDRKNEPDAADFYYGEMEMRRHGAESVVERTLLTAYWLISGYALRSWRAFASLIAVVALAVVGFVLFGFANTRTTVYVPVRQQIIQGQVPGSPAYATATVVRDRPGFATAVDYAIESATSLLRTPQIQPPLTTFGKALEILLRLTGPFLLGLALLALRGRLKR